MIDIPKTRAQAEDLLQLTGWTLKHSERFTRPDSDFQIWVKQGYQQQLRLFWPVDGDFNGATTTEIEIHRVLHFIRDARESTPPRKHLVFAYGYCPKCGNMCGNGGYGPLKCKCGWVSDDNPASEVDRIFEQEFGKED